MSDAAGAMAEQISRELAQIHGSLRQFFAGIERLAVALYDEGTDRLKTFAHSTTGGSPLARYEALLADVPSLQVLASAGRGRVVSDLTVFQGSAHEHTRLLLERGYRSSYTLPLHLNGRLFGFLFFDSCQLGYFTPLLVERLAVFAHMIQLVLIQGLTPVRLLESALHVVAKLSHLRDPDTGAHLQRMSRYARLIAQDLAADSGLADEFVEFVFLFAPAHDIGKLAVPDAILLKPGRLSEAEFAVIKTHVTRGAEIVDSIVREIGLQAFPHIELLRNIVLFHHEAVDGSGYPMGLHGDAIPLEARIVAVADVFDALTGERAYKPTWEPEDALDYLGERAGRQFDPACVRAMVACAGQAEEIRRHFQDAEAGLYQSREGYSLDL